MKKLNRLKRKVRSRTGMNLAEASEHLVKQANEETDPFMRKLLLFTAAGVAAQVAVNKLTKKK